MRLLHTGDWHLGRRLFGIDRLDEARAVLAEIAEIADTQRVDAVLVAGDLLDRRLVEPAVLGACLDALEALARVAPVVCVTGNHDDPALWAVLAPYLRARGVVVRALHEGADASVERVETAAGDLLVACVPWIDTPLLPRGGAAEVAAACGAALADAGDAAARVLLGHLMIQGARLGGGERELTVRDAHGIPGAALPRDLDYIALGHIHLAQDLPGHRGTGRYCGSPQQLDFGESAHEPQVAIVEISHGATTVRSTPLHQGRRLVRIGGPLAGLAAAAAEHAGAWFLCDVEVDAVVPDLVREVRSVVPDALRVEPHYPEEPRSEEAVTDTGRQSTRTVTEHYEDWYAATGRQLAPEHRAAFAAALAASE